MIIFPILCTVIAALCAGVMGFDTWRKARPDKVVWTIAFTLFAVAAGVEVIGSTSGWTSLLALTYYATGVALVVVFLAAGQMYLLFPAKMKRFGFGGLLLVVALWLSLVLGAPVDQSRLAVDGWDAIERGPELKTFGIFLNAVGTLIIVGGSGWAVVRFWRTGTHRNRMIGCLLILVGTLAVASGGSLQRLGNDEYLYIAMAVGVAIIFAGVLYARTPDTSPAVAMPESENLETSTQLIVRQTAPLLTASVTALGYLEHLLVLEDVERSNICREWSIARIETDSFTRDEARAVWHLRGQLSDAAVSQFDAAPVPTRRQLVELFDEVLTWPQSSPRFVSDDDAVGNHGSIRLPVTSTAAINVNGEDEISIRGQLEDKVNSHG